jgi:hypothetical protein
MDAEVAPAVEAFARTPQHKVTAHNPAREDLVKRDLAGPGNGKPLLPEEWVVKLRGGLCGPVTNLFHCHGCAPPEVEDRHPELQSSKSIAAVRNSNSEPNCCARCEGSGLRIERIRSSVHGKRGPVRGRFIQIIREGLRPVSGSC